MVAALCADGEIRVSDGDICQACGQKLEDPDDLELCLIIDIRNLTQDGAEVTKGSFFKFLTEPVEEGI